MNASRRYLLDILENLQRIEAFTRDGKTVFIADDKTQYAVIRAYEVIGEAAKRIPTELLNQRPDVNWQQVKGFRDFLIHNYDKIDFDLIWTAVEDAPKLKEAVEALLQDVESTDIPGDN